MAKINQNMQKSIKKVDQKNRSKYPKIDQDIQKSLKIRKDRSKFIQFLSVDNWNHTPCQIRQNSPAPQIVF